MSERAIITSDIHVHTYKQFNEDGRRLKNGIDYINYLFRLADANDIDLILIPGDLTNNMNIIATKVVKALIKCFRENFEKYHHMKVVAISGNHDFADKNLINSPAESAMQAFAEAFPLHFILLDAPDSEYRTIAGHRIVGIPYYEYTEHFVEALKVKQGIFYNSIIPGFTYLMIHQYVATGLPIDQIAPDDPVFDNYDMIFCGHYHDGSVITDRFVNIGSPMHRDAGDVGKNKGLWIIDLDEPKSSLGFKDLTDRYPQYIHKPVGEPLNEWEQQQYVIWVPNQTTENKSEVELSEKFRSDNSQSNLLQNYCQETLPVEDVVEKMAYILKLVV